MNYSEFGFRKGFDPNNRILKQENFEFDGAEYFISTVDLGLDHSFGDGPPLYYETMIFPKGDYRDMYCRRYSDREIATSAHENLVEAINNGVYEIVDGYFERSNKE